MPKLLFVCLACVTAAAFGCSSDPSEPGSPSGSPDASPIDTGTQDGGAADSAAPDGVPMATTCSADWTAPPQVDATLAIPADAGAPKVLFHTSAKGTQNYACTRTDGDAGATFAWTFTGPEADLFDCAGAKVGTHFASKDGPTRPQWQSPDGAYFVGKRLAGVTPAGGESAIPWLLVGRDSSDGPAGAILRRTTFVHRVRTTGGLAPKSPCDAASLGKVEKVPYTADYYDYGE